MATTKYAPKRQAIESNGSPSFEEESSIYSVAAGYIFDDPTVHSINRPDVVWREPASVRLPSVDEFDFEEAFGAKSLARKFGPRARYRSPNRDRWRFPDRQIEHYDERNAVWRDSPIEGAFPRGSRRRSFWGFCTSILIVIGMPFVFGILQPSNDVRSENMGDLRHDISNKSSAGHSNRADAGVEVADGDANSDQTILVPAHPMAVRSVSNAFAASTDRPTATGGSVIVAEQLESPAATSEESLDSGATALEAGTIDGATTEIPTPLSVAPAPAPDSGNDDFARMAQSQLSVNADPLQIETTAVAAAGQPVSGVAPLGVPPMSAAQIDGLLARGEELLRSGDIASARLLFLRVAAAGDRRGAKGVGMTYDPLVYARLPVTGLTPDREQAEIWYEKAGEDSTYTIDLTPSDTSLARADTFVARANTFEAQEAGSREWNEACTRKYKSFEPSTGLYMRRSGTKRRCQVP